MVRDPGEITVNTRQQPQEYRAAYDEYNNLIYEGWAEPGTAEDAGGWIICKYTYTNNRLTKKEWANGAKTRGIWDSRAGYFS